MDYFGIIKKAYEVTTRHKFLWIFGILAGGYGGFKSMNFNFGNYSGNGSEWQKSLESFNWTNFWTIWGSLIVTLIVIFFALGIVMFILSIISQGALVGSVDKLSRGTKSDFRDGFKTGAHQFWRILGVMILYFLMILASLFVWLGPLIVAIMTKVYFLAIIWGILLFFVDLAFWVLIGLISPYSLRFIVLEKYGVWQSIRESLHFFRDNWKEVVVIFLLLMATSIAFGIALTLSVLLTGGVLLAIGFGIFLASQLTAIIYGVSVSLVFFVALLVIAGAYNSFYSSALTLTYNHLSKKSS